MSLAVDRTQVTSMVLKDNFFVPAHPIAMILVPYGLYLTFSSYLCPQTCLSDQIPLGGLARYLGENFNFLMGVVSAIAAALHVGEAIKAFYLSSTVYNQALPSVVLWTLNVFFFGIFGFWPLAFPDYFYSVANSYCSFPGATCFGL